MQKKTSPDIPYLEGLFPRSLITCGKNVLSAITTPEGLCPLRIYLEGGLVRSFEAIKESSESQLGLLLPRFVEPHAHIDKAFTWKISPNFLGTYEGALKANFEEHKKRTIPKVRSRAIRSLDLALKNGFRSIRSHIDSFGLIGDYSWEALLELKHEWKSLIELQFVALVPLEYWGTNNGKNLVRKVANENGFLGGVIAPPYEKKKLRGQLLNLFSLANDFGCGIDLHIDETNQSPASGLRELINSLGQMKVEVPITCSHLSSMGLASKRCIRFFADKLADNEINVIALPRTNFWLLSKQEKSTSFQRPFAPIKELQNAGVTVAIGGDNVQDPWYPGGDFDPLSLMATSIPMTHLAPWTRSGLSVFTTAPARLMDLQWDGTLQVGSPADFVLLEANNWATAMSSSPARKVMIKGAWLE